MINKEKILRANPNSYTIKCGVCKQNYPKNKLTYNNTVGKKICIYCYKTIFIYTFSP
jgi:hypothetical protein